MGVVRQFLQLFGFDLNKLVLEYEKVVHPISVGNKDFLRQASSNNLISDDITRFPIDELENDFISALDEDHYIVVELSNIMENQHHVVVIYDQNETNFKIKDSWGSKYEIPKNRCSWFQVRCFLI